MHSYEALAQAYYRYMKGKYAQLSASSLTCRLQFNGASISYERRVALMLHCFVREVEKDVGLHTLLDAHNQFLELWICPPCGERN